MKNNMFRKTVVTGIIILFIGSAIVSSKNINFHRENFEKVNITIQTKGGITTINYHITDFNTKPITINRGDYSQIFLKDESNMLVKGMPELPTICRSIIIPDKEKMNIKVTNCRYKLYRGISVAPSKGNLLRTINPDDIPYEFNDIYKKDTWYPAQIAKLDKPYIIRDFRGQVVRIQPFQYNPIKKQLRFYTDITVEVYPKGVDKINCITRDNSPSMINSDFKQIYEHHFINYNVRFGYTPVEEQGNMLIITYDDFWPNMVPFVQWKNIQGIPTEMFNISEIGGADDIKTFITDYYNNYGLTFVLLVGDADQVPTLTANGYASDPSYSYVVGDDHYPDLFVGRFSAENISQLETQVERTIEYKEDLQNSTEWYYKGTGIASSQGPGDDGEYDWEHIRNIRTDLLGYHYTHVDELYDGTQGGEDAPGNPTSNMVSNVVNDGRSIINYCGHGTITSWVTTGFNNDDVNALTNDNMLPFIISVACGNGNFVLHTCFAEAWLRATHNSEPTGAIAAFMSSRPQSWDPPMDAQDEIIDILVESYPDNKKFTFGGLVFNGCMHMNDEYGEEGYNETDAWHLFGDPSLAMWWADYNIPGDLDHDGDVDLSDLAILLSNYGTTSGATYEDGDVDGDGDVDHDDLLLLLENYGRGT